MQKTGVSLQIPKEYLADKIWSDHFHLYPLNNEVQNKINSMYKHFSVTDPFCNFIKHVDSKF